MTENFRLKQKGAVWWTTADSGYTPRLSKNSLGEFMYEVLKIGAEIGEVWPFNINYKSSSVYFSVYMTEEMKNDLEARTKFRFILPPKIVLS